MKYIFLKGLVAGVLTLSLAMGTISCGSNVEKDRTEEETITEGIGERPDNRYDWNTLQSSATGTGGDRLQSVPTYYLKTDGCVKTSQSDTTRDTVRVVSEGVKLTGLENTDVMRAINQVVETAQKALEEDLSWFSKKTITYLQNKNGKGSVAEPLNFVSAAGMVFGHVYSVNIIYTHSYQIFDAEGGHIGEETEMEGRVLFNFDLQTGRVLKLSDLFYDDVNFVSLLTRKMNQIGDRLEYSFKRAIDGLPAEYDMFCLSGDGLVIGLPEGNRFTEEETWYSINLADIIPDMSVDPVACEDLFEESVVFSKTAFDVPDIYFEEYSMESPFHAEPVIFPLVAGIRTSETINNDLKSWYQEITQEAYYAEADLTKGGSISVEVASPYNMVNITVFVYLSAENKYMTLARCYSADTGLVMKAGGLIDANTKRNMTPEALETTNFRVGYDFTLGIPEQVGVEEDLVFTENQLIIQ